LPWSLKAADITEFEFRKLRSADQITYAATYEDATSHASQSGDLAAGVIGIHGRVLEHGLSTERF